MKAKKTKASSTTSPASEKHYVTFMYRELLNLAFRAYYEDKYPAIFADGRKPRTVTTKGVPA